jgi:hypothetical protein
MRTSIWSRSAGSSLMARPTAGHDAGSSAPMSVSARNAASGSSRSASGVSSARTERPSLRHGGTETQRAIRRCGLGRRVAVFAASVSAVLVLGCSFGGALAFGVESRPGWELSSSVFPTHIPPAGGTGVIEINVYNTGSQSSAGAVTVTDVLPAGVVAREAGDVQNGISEAIGEEGLWECRGNNPGEPPLIKFEKPATVVTCTNSKSLPIPEVYGTSNEVGSGTVAHIAIAIEATTGVVGTLANDVTVAGGGASSPASTSTGIAISPVPASFGFQDLDGWFSNADGTTDTQAGSHPYGFTFSLNLNTVLTHETGGASSRLEPAGGEGRDLAVDLPPGFIGNPTVIPQCTRQQFDFEECPPSTQVGIDQAAAKELSAPVPWRFSFPVYNLVPPPGVPAEFGLDLAGVQTFLDANVRSGGDYGLIVHVNNIGNVHLMYNNVTFWGEPADPLHNPSRFSKNGNVENGGFGCRSGCASSAPRVPFLTLPTSCEGPQTYSASLNTWATGAFGEASFLSHDSSDTPVGFTGCDHLDFRPSISTAPDTARTDTPAGLTVDVRAPQEGLTTPGALATSDIKNTTVTLPAGIAVNPGQAAGLQACQYSQSGLGVEPTPAEPSKGEPECPNASKVGTDEAVTPILFKPLKGNVYVLSSNPPHLKLLAALSGEGVIVKLVLDVELNEQTGQITTHVLNIPQAPVSDFTISFSGGAQAALATPTQCGTYQTTTDFTPWSNPALSDAFPSSSFTINAGSGGDECPPSTLPFTPTLTAGSTTDQAGGFTNFSLLLQRPDDQQRIAGLQFKAPPGLLAYLPHVAVCSNEQAEANACPEASKIGHTVVESGPGPYPLVVPEPGQEPAPIYLTGPYNGTGSCTVIEQGCAPFGLSIVVPLHVGPFTLPTQRVRAKIEINPYTTQLTVTTNPLPQEVAGVPTDLREVDALIEHPEFMINPTNCTQSSFSGTAYGVPPAGAGGTSANAPISSSFGMGSCQSLKFSPTFTATTSSKVTKKEGTSLVLKVTRPTGPTSQQANFSRFKIALPKQLPSRLTTLQKACTSKQFETNPANCPPASDVGHVRVLTPLLPVPLEGPAYFVSHGGEAFPNLVFLLQGDNVQVDTVSDTFISKAGITTGSLKAVPDAPFTSFELTLPSGPESVFTGIGNLCTQKLTMPTAIVAQNGLEIHENTKVAVTGCTKTKTLTRTQKLTTALKACHKNKKKTKRETCEKQARKQYGPTKTKKKK